MTLMIKGVGSAGLIMLEKLVSYYNTICRISGGEVAFNLHRTPMTNSLEHMIVGNVWVTLEKIKENGAISNFWTTLQVGNITV